MMWRIIRSLHGAARLVEFRDDKKTVATLHIKYHSVKSHFTTENEKEYPLRMSIKLVDGPFRRLEGVWHCRWPRNACKIGVPAVL